MSQGGPDQNVNGSMITDGSTGQYNLSRVENDNSYSYKPSSPPNHALTSHGAPTDHFSSVSPTDPYSRGDRAGTNSNVNQFRLSVSNSKQQKLLPVSRTSEKQHPPNGDSRAKQQF